MKSYKFQARRAFLAALLWAVCGVTFAGQGVVAPGNPPLTSDMVKKTAGFLEWALELRFSPVERQEHEQRMIRDWANEEKRKPALDLLQNIDKLASIPEERKRQVQQQVQNELLESLRKEKENGEAGWLLTIYDSAHPRGAGVSSPLHYAAVDGKQLVGKWRASKASTVQYKNSYTGTMAPTNGSSFFYEFKTDGSYMFTGLMQVTMYNCSTQVYSDYAGKYRVEGDRLLLEPAKGSFKTRQTCGSSYEKPGDLSKKEYSIHFEPNSSGAMLVIRDVAGSSRPDYFRPEK